MASNIGKFGGSMSDLSQEKCVPCRHGDDALTNAEIQSLMPSLPGWTVWKENELPKLMKQFKFKKYADALNFTVQVGNAADEQDHHPVIVLEWGKVTVYWWTHAINGLHRNDFIMAAATDRLYNAAQ